MIRHSHAVTRGDPLQQEQFTQCLENARTNYSCIFFRGIARLRGEALVGTLTFYFPSVYRPRLTRHPVEVASEKKREKRNATVQVQSESIPYCSNSLKVKFECRRNNPKPRLFTSQKVIPRRESRAENVRYMYSCLWEVSRNVRLSQRRVKTQSVYVYCIYPKAYGDNVH